MSAPGLESDPVDVDDPEFVEHTDRMQDIYVMEPTC